MAIGREHPALRPTVLVVQPDPLGKISRFGPWLRARGISLRTVRPYRRDVRLPSELEHDGLVVMGGHMSALDDDEHPWLDDVRRLIRNAAEAHRPTLGVCLGGQLMAQAFGGRVAVGDRGIETGVALLHWRSEAAADRLFGDLSDPFTVGTMHGDMVHTLPPDAVWLGQSTQYPHQAFRVGDSSWGIQFHPEIGHHQYREWADAFTGSATDRILVEKGAVALTRSRHEVLAGTRILANRFANLVLTPR